MRRTILTLSALALLSQAEETDQQFRMSRLLGEQARPRDLQHETRLALGLRSGEDLSVPLELAPGARLDFAWGVLKGAPAEGSIRFEARIGSRVIYSASTPSRARGGAWIPVSLTLPDGGRINLEFRGQHVDELGHPVASPVSAETIALSAPRIYLPTTGPSPRTLLWISLDAVRADHLGLYGYRRPTSSEIDRLAKDWVVFDRAIATAPWTLPSVASQFTSRHPSAHGGVQPTLKIDPGLPTVFSALAGEGFTVLGVSANGFVSRHFGLASGFDALWRTTGNADEVNRLAAGALEEWGGGDLALFLHYMDPHHDYTPPAPYDRMFDADYRGPIDGTGIQDLDTRLPARHRQHVEALYDGEIAFTDNRIRSLFDLLAARGVLENAVIVVSADHGEEFLDHGAWTHGRTVYNEVLHVPLLLRLPSSRPIRIAQVVSTIDIAPTILDAFGIERPPAFQGRSLLPLLRGDRFDDQPAFAETEYQTGEWIRLAVVDRNMAYLLAAPRLGGVIRSELPTEEVFDLDNDPRQRTPLPAAPRFTSLQRWASSYLDRVRDRPPKPPAEMTHELEQQLRALGYIR